MGFLSVYSLTMCIGTLLINTNCESPCDMSSMYQLIIVIVFLGTLVAIFDAAIAIISFRGTMSDETPRRHLSKVLYVSSFLLAVDAACSVELVIYYLTEGWSTENSCLQHQTCDRTAGTIIAILNFFHNWTCVLVQILILKNAKTDENESNSTGNIVIWRRRLEKIYGQHKKNNDTQLIYDDPHLKDVLQYLSALLYEITCENTYTASDLLAAIIIKIRNDLHIKNKSPSPTPQIIQNAFPKIASINEIIHFLDYAIVTYGNPGDAIRRLLQFIIRIIFPSFLRPMLYDHPYQADLTSLSSDKYINVNKNNRIISHETLDSNISMNTKIDLILYCTANSLFEVPFIVICDNEYKTVIIAIRGTLSIKDLFVDLYTDNAPLAYVQTPGDDAPNKELFYAHSGFLKSAQIIRDKLIKSNILDTIFSSDSKYKNYSLTCLGHSLGAAVASLLCYLLNSFHSEYPKARCIAYSPPGGVISPSASEVMKGYVISIIIGNDIVTRLTKESAMNLLHELYHILKTTNQNKTKIVWKHLILSKLGLGKKTYECNDSDYALMDYENPPESSFSSRLAPKTILPGLILHLIPRGHYGINTKNVVCDAIWASPEKFHRIKVCSNMVIDHIPKFAKRFINQNSIATYPRELDPDVKEVD